MLLSRDPEYLVTLDTEAGTQMLMHSLEHPEEDRHHCDATKIVGLAPRTWKLVFEEGFEAEAFRLLLLSAGLAFEPRARPQENHAIRELSSAEIDALLGVCNRIQTGAFDFRAAAKEAALGEEETADLTDSEGRLRFLVAEEVGPEVEEFLKKKAGKGKALYLAACI